MNSRLPIGTVVMLKNGTKRVMITGFYCEAGENKGKLYDYCGLLYPEGYIKPNELLLFDHNQIEKIYYLGLNDQENKELQKKLDELLANRQ